MKRFVGILIIAAVHLFATLWSTMTNFKLSGFFFGVYPRHNEGAYYTIVKALSRVLLFPLGLVAMRIPSGASVFGWVLVIINSLLWALVIYFLFRYLLFGRRAARRT
jgi:hypothetical protein